jgi:hypothetical protein
MAIKLSGEIVLVTGGNSVGSSAQSVCRPERASSLGVAGSPEFDVVVREIGSKTTAASAESPKIDDLEGTFKQIKEEKGRFDILCPVLVWAAPFQWGRSPKKSSISR